MPRDHKTPLVQKIASQAHDTFTGYDASARAGGGGEEEEEEEFTGRLSALVALLTEVRAADLRISSSRTGGAEDPGPPVSYMHICETEAFSMGVFLLRRGGSIPLHDHPAMHGMLKVLYGTVRIRCYDLDPHGGGQEEPHGGAGQEAPHGGAAREAPLFEPPLDPRQAGSVRRAVLRSAGLYSEESGPCLLTPRRDNLHRIDALDGPAAFLDILAPPYDSEAGRDCHYYRRLTRAPAPGAGSDHTAEEEETWLLEVPQPEDFWCGGEPYPGPAVSVQKTRLP